jgi:hypothetical protein
MIRIWKLRDAPQHLKDLCPLEADTTWVVEAPPEMRTEVEAIINGHLTPLRDIRSVSLPDGTVVFFGEQAIELSDQSSSKERTKASGAT